MNSNEKSQIVPLKWEEPITKVFQRWIDSKHRKKFFNEMTIKQCVLKPPWTIMLYPNRMVKIQKSENARYQQYVE